MTPAIYLFGYFLLLFLIGWMASGQIKTLSDYYAGGKKLNFWVVAFSSRATGSSAWVLLGLTGMGAIYGLHAFWAVLGTTLGVAVSWFAMAKRFKKLSDAYDSLTIPDFLDAHFTGKGHNLRIVAAFILSFFVIIYVSSQIDATGTAFEVFLGWDYFVGAIVGFVIVVAYMFAGGFIAVAWSDVFQGILMLLGLVLLPVVAFFYLEKGLWQSVAEKAPELLSFWGEGGFTGLNVSRATGFFMIGLGYLGMPQLYVRFLSIRNEQELKKGRWLSVGLQLLMNTSAVSAGILGRVLLTPAGADPESVLGNAGQGVLINLSGAVLPTVLSGMYVAAVLAAIMSTIDSLLVMASSAVTRDLYQQSYRPQTPEARLVRLSRLVTLLLAALALLLAMGVAISVPGRTIFWFVIFGWSGLAAAFCPVMILSLFWKGYTRRGAIASMIAGFVAVPIFKFAVPLLPTVGPYFGKMAELLPSFLVALAVGMLVSKSGPSSPPDFRAGGSVKSKGGQTGR